MAVFFFNHAVFAICDEERTCDLVELSVFHLGLILVILGI